MEEVEESAVESRGQAGESRGRGGGNRPPSPETFLGTSFRGASSGRGNEGAERFAPLHRLSYASSLKPLDMFCGEMEGSRRSVGVRARAIVVAAARVSGVDTRASRRARALAVKRDPMATRTPRDPDVGGNFRDARRRDDRDFRDPARSPSRRRPARSRHRRAGRHAGKRVCKSLAFAAGARPSARRRGSPAVRTLGTC